MFTLHLKMHICNSLNIKGLPKVPPYHLYLENALEFGKRKRVFNQFKGDLIVKKLWLRPWEQLG